MNDMCKVNLILKGGNGKNGEGVWAEFSSDNDKLIYDDEDREGEAFSVVIRNHPVTTNKIKFGGTVLVVNMGADRPVLAEPV